MAHQLTIEVEDSRFLSNCDTGKRKLSAYEQSLEDVEKGNVNSYDSAEELFKKMGI